MKVILAAVMSLDGKLTRHNESDLHGWVSHEDQAHFKALVEASDVIVLGRNTYDLAEGKLDLQPGKLRVVLTSHPEKYAGQEVVGQLSFVNEAPEGIVEILRMHEHEQLLVAGGTKILTDFLSAGLVDELYITIEPNIFGNGVSFTADQNLDIQLELIDQKKLNTQGTILAHYRVTK